jgi:hypothetical protein
MKRKDKNMTKLIVWFEVGENMSLQNMLLWNKYYFDVKAIEYVDMGKVLKT